jgi:hypothetical protein
VADPSETTQVGSGPALSDDAPDTREVLDAIQELANQVGSLQSEVRTLRAQNRPLPAGGSDALGWDDSRRGPDTLAWVNALETPHHRAPTVPRLLLEVIFVVGVAVAATIAKLDIAEIVAVMAVAWVLVALAEFAAARAARRRAEAVYLALPGLTSGYPTDPSWFAPPVERTALDAGTTEEGSQALLPPPSED